MRTTLRYLTAALVVLAIYSCGYMMGATGQQRANAKSNIILLNTYHTLADQGLFDQLKSRLSFWLYGETRACQALQQNRFSYLLPMLLHGEPTGERWEQIYREAQAFADRYQASGAVLDKQKIMDEVKARLAKSPTRR